MARYFLRSILILLIPFLVSAQDPLQLNSKYINFEIDRIPIISAGYFLQDGLALEAGVGFAFDGGVNSNGLAIRLGLDKYLDGERLVPFIGGYTRFDINPNALRQAAGKGSRLIFGGHWGLNFFVLKKLSLAGTIGAELQLNSPKGDDSSTNFTTLTSGIRVRFFF